jgi:hypothetical protein
MGPDRPVDMSARDGALDDPGPPAADPWPTFELAGPISTPRPAHLDGPRVIEQSERIEKSERSPRARPDFDDRGSNDEKNPKAATASERLTDLGYSPEEFPAAELLTRSDEEVVFALDAWDSAEAALAYLQAREAGTNSIDAARLAESAKSDDGVHLRTGGGP